MGARAGSKPLQGRTEPRIWTQPLRKLTKATTYGYELIAFARFIGEPFDPWQKWLAKHALEHYDDGSLRFRLLVVLIGRQNGKTHFVKVLSLWRMFLPADHPMRALLVIGAAQNLDISREAWDLAYETADATPELAARGLKQSNNNNNRYWRITEPNGPRYKTVTIKQGAGRGLSVDQLNLDELREQHDWSGWAALSKTTGARENGLIAAISNAGEDASVVLNHLVEIGRAGTDDTVGFFEWSAPDGCDLDDPNMWAMANPSLGYRRRVEAIRSELATDVPAVFRNEVLCQHVPALDPAIEEAALDACEDEAMTLDGLRDRVAAVLDVSLDLEHVSLLTAAVGDDDRARVEVAEAWESTDAAMAELPELLSRIRPRSFGWYPEGPGASLAAELRGVRNGQELTADAAAICMGFAEQVQSRRILHNGDSLLRAQALSAGKLWTGDRWRFARRGAPHVDAAYAAAGAVHLARTLPPPPPKPMIVTPRSS